MPILFMMPTWKAPSEVWMQRMIEQLQDDIVLIAADDAQPYWNNKIPGFCMREPIKQKNWWQRRIEQVKRIFIPELSREEKLASYAKRLGVTKILIHYAAYALEVRSLLNYLDAQLFIHCHGYDIAFHAFNDSYPPQAMHCDAYVDDLLSLPRETIFIANSQYTLRALKSIGISDENIALKYFGVEVNKEFPQRNQKEKVLILYLGRFIDCKGPDLTISAFNLARDMGLNAELIMAGEGLLSITCELKRIESNYMNDIHLLGQVSREEAVSLYKKADIFSMHHRLGPLSNREEAFGVSVIEAMAVGLPVVTGASGGVVESVINNKTGFLIESGSVQQHADALLLLGSDYNLRQKMGKAGWIRARDEFNMSKEKSTLRGILSL